MRQLKFRRPFYNKKTGEFSHFRYWYIYNRPVCSISYDAKPDEQYTGLKDGIYDNDIVKFNGRNRQIKWFEKWGMWGLVGESVYKTPDLDDPMGSGGSSTRYKPYILGPYYQSRIKKVGNIHENKDLLK